MDKKSRLRRLFFLVFLYLMCYLLSVAVFIGLFHTPLLRALDVLMYKGTVFIFLSAGIAAACMAALRLFRYRRLIDMRDVILLFCGCCCVNMVLFTLIPVTVERSVSVFMLSYMEEHAQEAFTQDQIEEIFIEKYISEYGAFEKRFHEQLVTGTVAQHADGTYQITKQGKQTVALFRLIADWFQTDRRLVYPCTQNNGS